MSKDIDEFLTFEFNISCSSKRNGLFNLGILRFFNSLIYIYIYLNVLYFVNYEKRILSFSILKERIAIILVLLTLKGLRVSSIQSLQNLTANPLC
jgi:hypothetical protein